MMCEKCAKMMAVLVLLVGVLFLLRDLNVWQFWNIQWWTVIFLLIGLKLFAVSGCPMCKKLNKK